MLLVFPRSLKIPKPTQSPSSGTLAMQLATEQLNSSPGTRNGAAAGSRQA
tara:strand:- start:1062 stop:1211 length:150 start_codon:yes stop_codon:yes gene_type:complete